MTKLLAVALSWLFPLLALAQSATAPEPEPVSPMVTYAFLIIFFGMIFGVGWYMWKSDRDEKAKKK